MAQVTTQPQQSTPRIFDRPAVAAHPWSDALKDLEKSNDAGRMALCGNLRMDHRVENQREQGMLNTPLLGGRPTGETFLTQWREYYQSALCRPASAISEDRLPAYLRPPNAGRGERRPLPLPVSPFQPIWDYHAVGRAPAQLPGGCPPAPFRRRRGGSLHG